MTFTDMPRIGQISIFMLTSTKGHPQVTRRNYFLATMFSLSHKASLVINNLFINNFLIVLILSTNLHNVSGFLPSQPTQHV